MRLATVAAFSIGIAVATPIDLGETRSFPREQPRDIVTHQGLEGRVKRLPNGVSPETAGSVSASEKLDSDSVQTSPIKRHNGVPNDILAGGIQPSTALLTAVPEIQKEAFPGLNFTEFINSLSLQGDGPSSISAAELEKLSSEIGETVKKTLQELEKTGRVSYYVVNPYCIIKSCKDPPGHPRARDISGMDANLVQVAGSSEGEGKRDPLQD
ncbi:hypothetical protein HBI44_096470 [Parastagonospora nodorum]|nr:hypothetical protein HBI47_002630 [Parastagonospora nodorum]KAH5697380.1 hypothetical protein HBI44_096470 [Parastagonospora nodorum]